MCEEKNDMKSCQDLNLGLLKFIMLVRCSYQLSHWNSGIGAEDRWYIYIHSLTLCVYGHTLMYHLSNFFSIVSAPVAGPTAENEECSVLSLSATDREIVQLTKFIQNTRLPNVLPWGQEALVMSQRCMWWWCSRRKTARLWMPRC